VPPRIEGAMSSNSSPKKRSGERKKKLGEEQGGGCSNPKGKVLASMDLIIRHKGERNKEEKRAVEGAEDHQAKKGTYRS